jgi:hypothetical protein
MRVTASGNIKMRRILIGCCIIAFALAGCQRPTPTPSPMLPRADNFAIAVNFIGCIQDNYDSSSGIFSQDMGSGKAAATVKIHLDDDQLEEIYSQAKAISFFDYPENYIPSGTENMFTQPDGAISLTITNGDQAHSVTLSLAAFLDKSKKTQDLDSLLKLLMDTLYASPEYKTLPDRGFGCA